jgi:hypothetical protein
MSETTARYRAAARARAAAQPEVYRANVAKARVLAYGGPLPEMTADDLRLYKKLRAALGAKAARQALFGKADQT